MFFFILGDPCLSFDVLPDHLGMDRNQYPHTIYIVCGTQAEKADRNSVMVVKMSNLAKTLKVRFERKIGIFMRDTIRAFGIYNVL